eukprot:SAG22_NODE_6321_length_870_cov_1.383917_2_plen_25_part_01
MWQLLRKPSLTETNIAHEIIPNPPP